MPVELSRTIAREMTRLGYSFVYREHTGVHPMAGGHYFPREEVPALVAWFDGRHRVAVPSRVTLVRDASHWRPLGWVRIDATDRIAAFSDDLTDRADALITEKVYARADAELTGSNRLGISTEHVRRLTLFLNERLVEFDRPLRIVVNGQPAFEGLLTPDAGTMLRDARQRRDPSMVFSTSLTIDVPAPAAPP
jgi:hypothetical protein